LAVARTLAGGMKRHEKEVGPMEFRLDLFAVRADQ